MKTPAWIQNELIVVEAKLEELQYYIRYPKMDTEENELQHQVSYYTGRKDTLTQVLDY